MKDIAVVILNFNGKQFLERFLQKTLDCSAEADVIVVDNASTDHSVPFLHASFPDVQVVSLKQNYGFAKGYNEGLKHLNYKYYILLNSDVEVSEGWIPPLISTLEKQEKVVAVQPKIKSFAHPEAYEYAGAAGGHLDLFGYAFCRGRVFDTVEKDHGQYEDASEIFWASGACMAVKASAFKEENGFDERFFAHMEEIDLCWRWLNKGYSILFVPQSQVYHIGGGTLQTGSSFKTYLNFRNNLAMMFKNLPGKYLIPVLFARLSLDGISGIRFLLQGSPSLLWAVLKSHFMFYYWLPYLIKKRNGSYLGYQRLFKGSIVKAYFLDGKKTYKEICSK